MNEEQTAQEVRIEMVMALGATIAFLVLLPVSILFPISVTHSANSTRELLHPVGVLGAFLCFLLNCRSWRLVVTAMAHNAVAHQRDESKETTAAVEENDREEQTPKTPIKTIICLKIISILLLILAVVFQRGVFLPSVLLSFACFIFAGSFLLAALMRVERIETKKEGESQ